MKARCTECNTELPGNNCDKCPNSECELKNGGIKLTRAAIKLIAEQAKGPSNKTQSEARSQLKGAAQRLLIQTGYQTLIFSRASALSRNNVLVEGLYSSVLCASALC